MKRDIDLIRQIMLRVEEAGEIMNVRELGVLVKSDLLTVAIHVEWLAEAGFLKVEYLISGTSETPLDGVIFRQTWKGCEFLDAARNEEIWTKAKKIVGKHAGTISFQTFQQLLNDVAKSYLTGNGMLE